MSTAKVVQEMKGVYENLDMFYDQVVPDGRRDIHPGMYLTPEDTALQASENVVKVVVRLAREVGALFAPGVCVVDLGAGNGGAAHEIAQQTGAHVTCVNVLQVQNRFNRDRVRELGLLDRVDVFDGSYDAMPAEWDSQFDIVMSIDAFVHAVDKPRTIAEAFRVAKPGAVFVFSDIMMGSNALEENVTEYKKRNRITTDLLSMEQYEELVKEAGFVVLRTRDFTGHLVPTYRRLNERTQMLWEDIEQSKHGFMEKYMTSFLRSIDKLTEVEAQAWSAIVAVKPRNGEYQAARSASGRLG